MSALPDPESPSPSPLSTGLSLVTSKDNRLAQTLGMATLIGGAALKGYKWASERRKKKTTVRFRFREGSLEYQWLLAWLKRHTNNFVGCEFEVSYHRKDPPSWTVLPRDAEPFLHRGVQISIERTTPQHSDIHAPRESPSIVLILESTNKARALSILNELADFGEELERQKQPVGVHVLNRWDGWTRVRDIPKYYDPVLPNKMLDVLLEDAQTFLGSREWYTNVGVPWRRGYMFHGIPGSGKTTTAMALARHLHKELYIVNTATLKEEDAFRAFDLEDALLLLEDIDCAAAVLDRETQDTPSQTPTVGLQTLLNLLDGATSREGRVIVATTNHVSTIDRALLRPGRFDQSFEFQYAAEPEIAELCHRFGETRHEELSQQWAKEQIAMSTVQERLLQRTRLRKT